MFLKVRSTFDDMSTIVLNDYIALSKMKFKSVASSYLVSICIKDKCKEDQMPLCPHWKSMCSIYKDYMEDNCPMACGVCVPKVKT